jgi:hypothetical protein
VTVSIPALTFNQSAMIPAAMSVVFNLPKEADLGESNDTVEKKGIHVTATQPVAIYGLSKVAFTSDGYLALHTEAIGTEYVIQSFDNVHTAIPELNGTQFAIVGTQNDTTIAIVPSVVTLGHDSGFPFVIKLQQGETYQLRNIEGAPQDLSGTLILADKPIAVFGSHMCANVQSANPAFCDYLVEQLIPVNRWGVDYLTRPLETRAGDTYRVLAAFDGTVVNVNGLAVATLNRGGVYETVRTVPLRITANRPIHVSQFANSSDFDLVDNADPFMVQVPHKALYSVDHRFCVPAGFASHYINVIAPSGVASLGLVLLDGAPIPAGSFSPIGASGYSAASVTVAPGVRRVLAPQPVGVTVYGWAEHESYAWPACFFFGDTTPPVVTCPPAVTVDLGQFAGTTAAVPCKVPVPDLRPQVTFTDNCPRTPNSTVGGVPNAGVVQQEPPPGTLLGPGEYEIVLSVSDSRGNVGSCVTKFTVIAAPPNPNAQPVLHCPSNMQVKCASAAGAVVDYTAFATIGCDEVPLVCTPPPGTPFPVGVTTVNCALNNTTPPRTCSFTVTVACAPQLTFTLSAAVLTFTWSGPAVLQQADTINGPWTNVSVTGNRFEATVTASPQRYFRLRE